MQEGLMNLTEAAAYLGVTRHTLGRWIRDGSDVPHQKVNQRRYYFSRQALGDWAAGKKEHSSLPTAT